MDTVSWLSLTINETLKWLSSLSILMQESFLRWQCSDRYIISLFPHLHAFFSLSLVSLMVSVDVKHHVCLLQWPLVPNKPYDLCGSKAPWKKKKQRPFACSPFERRPGPEVVVNSQQNCVCSFRKAFYANNLQFAATTICRCNSQIVVATANDTQAAEMTAVLYRMTCYHPVLTLSPHTSLCYMYMLKTRTCDSHWCNPGI